MTVSKSLITILPPFRPDFVKWQAAHNPPNSKVWHDSYRIPFDGLWLYLKFAGETLIDIVLTSFKEA